MDKHVLKCIRKGKDPTIAKIILKKKSKVRRVILLNVKSCHIITVIEHWYWNRNRHID